MNTRSTRIHSLACALRPRRVRAAAGAQTDHPAQATLRLQHRRRLSARHLHAVSAYWQKLDKESDRMKVVEIGKTAEGRPQSMAIVTSPENHKQLDRYKEISRRLHRARGIDEAQARALAKEGKGGGLVRRRPARDGSPRRPSADRDRLSAGQPHRCGDRRDSSTTWSSWPSTPTRTGWRWSRAGTCENADPAARRTCSPRLYQKYVGHDNNRDFYMSNAPESPEHEQADVLGVAAADHVQPPPVRSCRHGAVLPSVPRSLQLQLRSHDRHRARHGRCGDAQPLPARKGSRGSRGDRGRPIPRGGTAGCGRWRTSRTSSAC